VTNKNTMLLDTISPQFHLNEIHAIQVHAPQETVFRALEDLALEEISPVVSLLLSLRSLPEKMVGRKRIVAKDREPFLAAIFKGGFTLLAEEAPSEVVFGNMVPGSIGRIWRPSSGQAVTLKSPEEFLAFNDPGYVVVTANLFIEEGEVPGWVTVRTESRCRALSPQALKQFLPYWRIIRPFSGLIRRLWLRGIKNLAEKRSPR
jgi:hypothetical protein